MENLNIIEILKFGLPGLVFLLSFMSYRLLSIEADKDNPSDKVLSNIRVFMYLSFFLAILTASSPVIENFYFHEESEVHQLKAQKNLPSLMEGAAAVCMGATYNNRFLLVKDLKTSKLIQVFAMTPIPCTDEFRIVLNPKDAANLGWGETIDSTVEIIAAAPGYKFAI